MTGRFQLIFFLAAVFLVSLACAVSIPYTATVFSPAGLSIGIDAPSRIHSGSEFTVFANITNTGTEKATGVTAELIFTDLDNDPAHARKAFTYREPVKTIGTLEGSASRTVHWDVESRKEKRFIGNYTILVRARGTAEISGDGLSTEEVKPFHLPGFGPLAALGGVLLAALVMRRSGRR